MSDKLLNTNSMSLEALLAAPFVAAAKANAYMSHEQFEQLMGTCFTTTTDKEGNKKQSPIYIDMVLERKVILPSEDAEKDIKFDSEVMTLSVPMLTLLPLSSLNITNIDLDYSLEIVTQQNRSVTRNSKSKNQSKNETSQSNNNAPLLNAAVSNKSTQSEGSQQSSNKSLLHVKMKASQTPLPEGMKVLIEAFSKNLNVSK